MYLLILVILPMCSSFQNHFKQAAKTIADIYEAC
jgi:hypothetical protein